MKKVTKVFEVYRYDELSSSAKNKALSYVIEHMCDTDYFTDECQWELNMMFPNSDLKVEYYLGYSQGDYFNFYGEIDLNDILNRVIAKLTKKQIRLFRHIIKYWKDAHKISSTSYYNLNIANNCNIFDDVIDDMEQYGYRDIPENDIIAIANIASELLRNICNSLMDNGYAYFDPPDTEIESFCSDSDLYFTIDGEPYFD